LFYSRSARQGTLANPSLDTQYSATKAYHVIRNIAMPSPENESALADPDAVAFSVPVWYFNCVSRDRRQLHKERRILGKAFAASTEQLCLKRQPKSHHTETAKDTIARRSSPLGSNAAKDLKKKPRWKI